MARIHSVENLFIIIIIIIHYCCCYYYYYYYLKVSNNLYFKVIHIPYLPVYNACLCIIRTPILGLYFQKKKKKRIKKQRKSLWKNSVNTSWFGNTLKTTLDHLFRNVTQCTSHKTISSSDGLFWRSAFVKSWILSTVHSIQLLDYSRNTMVNQSARN